jgi:hypothetical protein
MNDDFDLIEKNEVLELCELPNDRETIGYK